MKVDKSLSMASVFINGFSLHFVICSSLPQMLCSWAITTLFHQSYLSTGKSIQVRVLNRLKHTNVTGTTALSFMLLYVFHLLGKI